MKEFKEYYSNSTDFKDKEVFEKTYNRMPKVRKDKIDSFMFEKDKLLSLAAGYLVDKVLNEYHIESTKINYNKYGKPYVVDNPLHFSLSHSHEKAYLVVSSSSIGCDVEYIAKVDYMKLAKRFYTENEYQYLLNSKDKVNDFYRLWTIKEAYLKMIGKGLTDNMNSFDVDLDSMAISSGDIVAKSEIKDGYAYAVVIKK